MKTILFVLAFGAQLLGVPLSVQQGGLLVLQRNNNEESVQVFDKTYYFDGHGRAYIGVAVDQEPGKYDVDSYVVDVTPTDFPLEPWRMHWYAPPTKKRQKEIDTFRQIFGSAVNIRTDLVHGSSYNSPLETPLADLALTEQFVPVHKGVDIQTKWSKFDKGLWPVHSVNNGIVALAGKFSLEGNMVIIDHGLGIFSVYMHLSKIMVAQGQTVSAGQQIAIAGSTGRVTGPHLHFAVNIQDVYVNPINFIKEANKYSGW